MNLIQKAIDKNRLYPLLEVPVNTSPNKLYSIPFLGFFIKMVILIPVFIIALGLGIATFILLLINPFMVLATGVYWKTAYEILVMEARYTAKITLFVYGLTDKYPGFNFNTEGFSLELPYPKTVNKLYAVPLVGLFIRVILMIPFSIFSNIIANGAAVGIFLAGWIAVLFQSRYAESLHEIGQDTVRMQLTSMMYFSGLEDRYPSFWISMNHKNIKILLIIIGILLTLNSYSSYGRGKSESLNSSQNYRYQNSVTNPYAP